MDVLFLTHYYPPEVGAPQARISELAVRLRALGHGVTVLTGMPHYPDGVLPPHYRWRLLMREEMAGVPVVRTWVYPARNAGFAGRLLDHASFTLSSLGGVPVLGRCDVVVTECPPLFTGLAGLAIGRLKGARHVFHVADLWPESPVALGALRSRALVAGATALSRFIYERSDLVTVSARGQKDALVGRGVPADKIEHLSNAVDVTRFRPGTGNPAFRSAHGLEGKFVVLYHGTHGAAHGLDSVLDAARALAGRREGDGIAFVLVGDGMEKRRLAERRAREGIANVVMLDAVLPAEIPALINECDLGLVHLKRLPVFEAVLPSKMFEFMACGRPLVMAVGGEAGEIVRRTECGVCVPPESPADLAAAVLDLRDRPEACRRMGENGRRSVEQEFSRERLARRWEAALERLVGSRRAA